MKLYVGVTDGDWYDHIKTNNLQEANFWRPGSQPFKVLERNDLFLFKLHYPLIYIVGGGSLLATHIYLLTLLGKYLRRIMV